MISKKLQDAINLQINKELHSEYIYLSMAAYFYSNDLDGIANFFSVQTQEEHFHAMKLFNYLLERGGKIELKTIEGPPIDFKSHVDVFEQTLAHEQYITKSINELMDMAIKENDHSLVSFLKWYVDEQVEEEATASRLLARIKIINGNGQGLLMMDAELSQRTFTPPGSE
ncbi:MAG: ferritin [Ignavibacteria bacterium]|nr:ferritin [Ignavibacteria bacterium]